ncbi:MAG: hypothetical protein LBL63_01095 [Clostridiales Family XIII bacterium]|jgi:hypothetical protein|nr:hypothetical protein [Clostridiales Family XIII bacterium]
MGEFFGTFLSAVQVRFLALIAKVRVLVSPVWWKTHGTVSLRKFFSKMLDVRPRGRGDYYPVLRWLVSKRLAFAIVIAIGVVSIFYVLVFSPVAVTGKSAGNASLPVYRYNSLAVRFFDGSCRVKARGGYIAYEGAIQKGMAKGEGRLYDRDGDVVYEGAFDENMYNGMGKLYYPNGNLKYEGGFINNRMSGEGKLYASSGALRYEGEFLNGKKNGEGTLYNASANEVYHGNFVLDHIPYEEFVGKASEDVSAMYLGQQNIYAADPEFAIFMKEIDVIAATTSGADDLEGESKITGVTVLSDVFANAGKSYARISEISALFGQPDYAGYTYCILSDAVALNALPDTSRLGRVPMDTAGLFDGVYRVDGYDRNTELYIYAYRSDDVLYTFYCGGPREQEFFMYSMEVGE